MKNASRRSTIQAPSTPASTASSSDLDERALHVRGVERRGHHGHRQVAAPPLKPSTSARVLASIELQVGRARPSPRGPSESAHSGRPTFAPASRAIACSTFGLTELSANTAGTPLGAGSSSTSSAVSPADGCAARRQRRDHRADRPRCRSGARSSRARRAWSRACAARGGTFAMQRGDGAVERAQRARVGARVGVVGARRARIGADQRARIARDGALARCAGPATSAGRRRAGRTWSSSVTTGASVPAPSMRVLQPVVDVAAGAHARGPRRRARSTSCGRDLVARAGRRSARAAARPRTRAPPTLRTRSAACVVVATTRPAVRRRGAAVAAAGERRAGDAAGGEEGGARARALQLLKIILVCILALRIGAMARTALAEHAQQRARARRATAPAARAKRCSRCSPARTAA